MSKTSQRTRTGEMQALKYRIHELKPLLEVDKHSEFDVSDVDSPNTNMQLNQVLKFAKHKNAIQDVRTIRFERDNGKIGKRTRYRWDPVVFDRLKSYLETMNTLPCGHQAHVYNARETDKLSCKYCAEKDEYPEYEKEFVRGLL